MQLTILSPSVCALVPHSTRPVWHQWHNNSENNSDKENIENKSNIYKCSSTARRRLFFEDGGNVNNNKQNKVKRWNLV